MIFLVLYLAAALYTGARIYNYSLADLGEPEDGFDHLAYGYFSFFGGAGWPVVWICIGISKLAGALR